MSFKDQLAPLIATDKQDAAKSILDALDKQLTDYGTDIDKLKREARAKAEIKPEMLAELEKEIENLKATNNELSTKLTKADIDAKKATNDLKIANDTLKKTSEAARTYKEDVMMRKALGDVKIGTKNAEDLNDAMSFIRSKVFYETVDNVEKAFVNAEITKDGKVTVEKQEFETYITKTYPTTSHAKRFIPGKSNTGAGVERASGNPESESNAPKTGKTVLDTLRISREVNAESEA